MNLFQEATDIIVKMGHATDIQEDFACYDAAIPYRCTHPATEYLLDGIMKMVEETRGEILYGANVSSRKGQFSVSYRHTENRKPPTHTMHAALEGVQKYIRTNLEREPDGSYTLPVNISFPQLDKVIVALAQEYQVEGSVRVKKDNHLSDHNMRDVTNRILPQLSRKASVGDPETINEMGEYMSRVGPQWMAFGNPKSITMTEEAAKAIFTEGTGISLPGLLAERAREERTR